MLNKLLNTHARKVVSMLNASSAMPNCQYMQAGHADPIAVGFFSASGTQAIDPGIFRDL